MPSMKRPMQAAKVRHELLSTMCLSVMPARVADFESLPSVHTACPAGLVPHVLRR